MLISGENGVLENSAAVYQIWNLPPGPVSAEPSASS